MAVIAKKKLSEKVVDEIRKRMTSGELKVGDKLPNQNALAREFGVSLTSLREAMNILSMLGVIDQRPGYGTEIIQPIPETMPEGVRPVFLADRKAILGLLEARMIIEPGSAFLTAREASDDQIHELSGLVEQMKVLFRDSDFKGYALADQRFHKRITDFSNNAYIKQAYVFVEQHMAEFIKENVLLRYHFLPGSQRNHEAIFQAISQRDPDRAAQEMKIHIQFLLDSFSSHKK